MSRRENSWTNAKILLEIACEVGGVLVTGVLGYILEWNTAAN
jgi:hypothetical protein